MTVYEIEQEVINFHNTYENNAKKYGYETRKDTKELDLDSPNGRTMIATVFEILQPYTEKIEKLEEEIKELEEDKSKMFETAVKNNNKLMDRIYNAIEYIDFMIKHYKEQLDTPIDDTYFINDDLRKAYILSIKAYLQVLLDILQGGDKE